MLSPALPVEIYLCVQPTDMRKSFYGLWALVFGVFGVSVRGQAGIRD